MTWILVALGGAAGAAARFVVDVLVTRWTGGRWPWGTLVVNVSGSAALGVLVGLDPGPRWLDLLAVGACGSFTTASTFSWEALLLLRQHRRGPALAYVGLTVVLATAAYALGRRLAT